MSDFPNSVLITGVSSGIGHGLAKYYLDQGCHVFGTSRRSPNDLISHTMFRFVSLDLLEGSQIQPRLVDLLDNVESLDLLILNAGILGRFGDLADADQADLKNTMQVNVWANKLVLDALYQRDLRVKQVVAISSGAAVNGNRGWSGYSVSKAALNMLIKLYSCEQPDTHFCAFAPGIVDTAMQEELCSRSPDERYQAVETLRSKRGTPDMPSPDEAASRLAEAMSRLPEMVESGSYADVRSLLEA